MPLGSSDSASRAARIAAAAVCAAAIAALLAPAPALAHPHIFFDLEIAVSLRDGNFALVTWTLFPNEATCAAMFMEADLDCDNAISDSELAELDERWKEYFSRFAFFVTARSDGIDLEPASVEWRQMRVLPREGDFPFFSLSYDVRFDLPDRAAGDHSLEADTTDKTFYAAFFQKRDRIAVESTDLRVESARTKLLEHGRGISIEYALSDTASARQAGDPTVRAPPAIETMPTPRKSLRARFNEALRLGIDWLSSKVLSLSKRFQAGVFMAFLGFALLYGMFHALGPGHGKALVAAFLVRGNGKPKHALILAVVVAVTHTGMAVLIAAAIRIAGIGMRGEQYRERSQAWVGLASGVLVIMIGLFPALSLAARKLVFALRLRGKGPPCAAQPSPSSEKPASEYELTLARVGRWGVATGLVPCPASLVILFISMGAGVFWLGMLAVAALALGLSAVLLAIGLSVVYSRRGIMSRLSDSRRVAAAQAALSVGGGILVVALGALLVSFYADRLAALSAC